MNDNLVPFPPRPFFRSGGLPATKEMRLNDAAIRLAEGNSEQIRFTFRFLGSVAALVDDALWDEALWLTEQAWLNDKAVESPREPS